VQTHATACTMPLRLSAWKHKLSQSSAQTLACRPCSTATTQRQGRGTTWCHFSRAQQNKGMRELNVFSARSQYRRCNKRKCHCYLVTIALNPKTQKTPLTPSTHLQGFCQGGKHSGDANPWFGVPGALFGARTNCH
jgi:hypothetical protein